MVIDKIRKMSVKGVKSESFVSLSPGVLELWRKTLRGRIPPPIPGPDRVKMKHNSRSADVITWLAPGVAVVKFRLDGR